jgi:hypothetical protein
MIPFPYEVRDALLWLDGIAKRANCQLSVGANGIGYVPMNEVERPISNGEAPDVAMVIVSKLRVTKS